MAIPYRAAKLKFANTFAMAIWDPTSEFNSRWLYGIAGYNQESGYRNGTRTDPDCMEKMKACILRFLVSSLALCICAAQVPVDPKMRSFSSAIKSGLLAAGQELLLYESNTGEPGIITEQWFTGMRCSLHAWTLLELCYFL